MGLGEYTSKQKSDDVAWCDLMKCESIVFVAKLTRSLTDRLPCA